jgi:RsiW-degrading membrane proteinase PrsW (M82 family)
MDFNLIATIILAIIPSIILLTYIYKKDVVEKEPIPLLMILFLFGIISTVPAVFLENLFQTMFSEKNSMFMLLFYSFVGIALIEEGYKALFTYLIVYRNKNFNHIFDGIVYAVFMSLGFATLENFLYLYKYGIDLAISRGIISVPAHAFYAISFGFFLGKAKKEDLSGNIVKSKLYLALSVLVPVLLHGTFDFLLLSGSSILYKVFVLFVVFLYLLSLLQVKIHGNVMTMLDN